MKVDVSPNTSKCFKRGGGILWLEALTVGTLKPSQATNGRCSCVATVAKLAFEEKMEKNARPGGGARGATVGFARGCNKQERKVMGLRAPNPGLQGTPVWCLIMLIGFGTNV
eukprot:GGOE01009149.1.p2 GENE.GGOE01009149.1~~GGOE01009149.1.p2  ORF type:complete len:112 (+),score=4.18 GGOE01009149.1:388-723(+)